MLGSLRTALFALLACGVLAYASKAPSRDPSINDGAGLFSKEAVQKAESKIAQIKRDYNRDVVIETFAEAKDMTRAKEDRNAYFREWGLDRYKSRGVSGVHVLITKVPGRVQVTVGNKTRTQAINDARRDTIREKFTSNLAKNPDQALNAAVTYIDDVFSTTLKRTSTTPPVTGSSASSTGGDGMNWVSWVVIGVVALLVIWLVVGLIRAFSGNTGGQGGGNYQPGYGGGGGFFSSLMGGLFGAAAGMWLYHSMFGGGTPHAYGGGGGYDNSGGMNDNDATSGGGDYDAGSGGDAGGGGDWGGGGSDTGGGDWGGGDTGGGDWGGGGGGDWGGGGGGDW